MRCVALAACLMPWGLSACHAQPTNPAPEASPSPPLAASIAGASDLGTVTTLAGEWRVAGIDGQPLDQPVGIALSASSEEIWWAPRCAGFVRSYAIQGQGFAARPALGVKPRKPGEPTPPVCTIAPPPGAAELFRALDAAQTIRRTPENGVLISGGAHSVLLFSQ